MKDIIPGKSLLRSVRSEFINHSTSLNSWCISNNIKPQNARLCLLGDWNGPKAKILRLKIIHASTGIELKKDNKAA